MSVPVKSSAGGGAALFLSFRRSVNHPLPSHVSFQNVNMEHNFRPSTVFSVAKRSPKRLKYSAPRFTKEGGLLCVEVDPSGSDSWKLDPVVKLLKEGAVGVIPTDTVAEVNEANEVMECINKFCQWSGQVVNKEKSVIHFSKNVAQERKICLGAVLDFGECGHKTSYLIVEKVRSKMVSWKLTTLSQAGRSILVKSVIPCPYT